MSNHGDWHGGSEQTVEALGKTWRLDRQRRHVWREFAKWGKEVLPDPIETVARHLHMVADADTKIMRELMRGDVQEQAKYGLKGVFLAPCFRQLSETLTDKALDKASSYLNFGSPELLSLLNNPEGQIKMLWLLLQKYHGEDSDQPADEDAADDICNELGFDKLTQLFRTAGGHTPEPKKKEPGASPNGAGDKGAATPTGGPSTAASCASAERPSSRSRK